jgi:hypothetical protein
MMHSDRGKTGVDGRVACVPGMTGTWRTHADAWAQHGEKTRPTSGPCVEETSRI